MSALTAAQAKALGVLAETPLVWCIPDQSYHRTDNYEPVAGFDHEDLLELRRASLLVTVRYEHRITKRGRAALAAYTKDHDQCA